VRAPILVGAALVALSSLAAPAWADLYAVDPKAHTLSEKELWQLAVRSSQVVLLGRIMAPLAPADTLHYVADGNVIEMPEPVFALPIRIEPIEFLKGGLDGDIVEARYRFGGLSRRNPATVTALAGVDTLGAIFFLKQEDHEWWLVSIQPPHPKEGYSSYSPRLEREMYEGMVILSQRNWTETLERVRAWIQEMPPDSARSTSGLPPAHP
jgi:hypothetical protein